jgi:BRCA1-associated protein
MYRVIIQLKPGMIEPFNTDVGGSKGKETSMQDDKVDKIEFFSGNPSVEVSNGIIHLYRDDKFDLHDHFSKPAKRSDMVCVMAVPANMPIADFVSFTGPCQKNITNMRIIRDSSPNRYMVIIKYKDQAAADEFYTIFNGTKYNSLEPELCHILYVAQVEYFSSDVPLFPPSGQVELPTCPVCLERLDSSASGILTILCNHSFHCDCLSKWRTDSSCPVCRYIQHPVEMTSSCNACGTTESLWICLICGHVGCGRYVNFHAEQHYRETMHTYALELETQRVWDYAGDGYVHRIIQNKTDGKLVEFPGVNMPSDFRYEKDEAKIEAITMEYNFLLTSQLEAQRAYFEQQIAQIQKEKANCQNDKIKAEQKMFKLAERLEKQGKELSFLKGVNASLCKNQDEWKARVAQLEQRLQDTTKDEQIQELKEQLRDMMFFIEAKKTIEQSSDMKDGSLVVLSNENSNNSTVLKKPKAYKAKKR